MWITERANGTYQYGERYKDPYTNKYKRVYVTLDSKSNQAQKKANKMLNDIIDERLSETQVKNVPFRKVKEEWLAGHKRTIRPSSQGVYDSAIKIIDSYFEEDVLIDRMDARLIQKFFDSLDYSNDYLSSIKGILNQIFDYALDKSMITQTPMQNVKIKYKAKTLEDYRRIEDKYLEKDEAEALINELYRRGRTYRLGRLAEFMYLTGTRIGEAIILTPLEIKDNIIRITGTMDYTQGFGRGKKGPTKTIKGMRDILITQRTIDLIERTIEENKLDSLNEPRYNDRGFIFVTKTGTPIQVNSFNLALKSAAQRVGIDKHMSSHIFRHTHTSILAEMNIPLKAVMDRLGHADAKITNEIYTHVTKKMKLTILDKLEENNL